MQALEEKWNQLQKLLSDCQVKDRILLSKKTSRLWPPKNPKAVAPKIEKMLKQAISSVAVTEKRKKTLPIPTYPNELPVAQRSKEIVRMIQKHQVIVLSGATGSGKTTQLPKMCLDAGLGACGRIACTQPRRVAAMSVSQRIAEELKTPWGKQVGCKIRFTDHTAPETAIKMMTDGMLLSEIQTDPDLLEYEVVIVDEAHERSLNIDFLLGYLNILRKRRPDLKIIITSATIDTEMFSKSFGDAPIVEVSGRTFPVEVRYRPLDEILEEEGSLSYIDAACQSVEDLVAENRPGDILVFLPGERDIRELRDLLDGRHMGRCEILPLFGRLTGAEQQRIFASSRKRKIILATNIAETSITVPGIRYVVDTGVARVSRYSPHTHTQRLPIEAISQSSADQRKGRCGRVEEGVCIRLYSEADYESRPRFTQPEILRSNLAAVILRMMAFRIGDVYSFPFVDPPQERAIRAGFNLLQDLGAIDETQKLTPLGRQLARLPVDPTVGRMLLQARKEGALREVLVIASGLSVQDPRERPMDKREEAERMHRTFYSENSDFLTLLNIWNAFHEALDAMTQNQLRRFCKKHFLSYQRMREWRDIHHQLERVLKEMKLLDKGAHADAEYHQIHRSLLTGLLGNIAERDMGNHYRATHNRNVMVFPGSTLFDKQAAKAERKKFKGQQKPTNSSGKRTPKWIMCGEWSETTRLYARNCASIEMPWISELASHILKKKYVDPRYDVKGQRVVIKERLFLYGLEVGTRNVGFSQLDAQEATDIFVREALVEEQLRDKFKFLEHNKELREEVEEWQTRLRQSTGWHLDDRIFAFYRQRLESVGSVHELRKFIKEKLGGKQESLYFSREDLVDAEDDDLQEQAFPDGVTLNGLQFGLNYAYKPGQDDDGATLKVPIEQFESIEAGLLDWIVPGYLKERVEILIRSLPKDIRKQLFPISDKAQELCQRLRPSPKPMTEQLSERILEDYGVRVWPRDWPEDAIPEYLQPRIEVMDSKSNVIAAGRKWDKVNKVYEETIRKAAETGKGNDDLTIWAEARKKYERVDLREWTLGSLPEFLEIGTLAGVPVRAYPGLKMEEGSVCLRLFTNGEEAARFSKAAWRYLCELACGKDMGWFQKDLKQELKRANFLASSFITPDKLLEHSLNLLRRYLFPIDGILPLQENHFKKCVNDACQMMRGLPQRYVDALYQVLDGRQSLVMQQGYQGMQGDLQRLVPADFLLRMDYSRLQRLPAYFKAMEIRMKRAATNPARDLQKLKQVEPYRGKLNELAKMATTAIRRKLYTDFFWLLEEYKINIFAQEVGTVVKASPKRLDEILIKFNKQPKK